jgi:hypothetical protein
MLPGLPGLVLTPAGAPFGFGASLPSMPAPPLWMPPQAAPSSGLLQAPPGAVWDHNDLAHNFNTMTLTPPPNIKWYMNSGASSHRASNSGILSRVFSPNYSTLLASSLVMGHCCLLLPPVILTSHLPLIPFIFMMFWFLLISSKILYMSVALQLIILFLLNLTHLAFP